MKGTILIIIVILCNGMVDASKCFCFIFFNEMTQNFSLLQVRYLPCSVC